MRTHRTASNVGRIAVVAAVVPLALLVAGAYRDTLGANPIETVTRTTGDWTLRFLLITLAITPLRRLFDWPAIMRLRRTFGLLAFFYACTHVLAYVWLDQFFDVTAIARDIVERPFITAGFVAFVLLVPLAVTSNRRSMLRLGRRWQRLHRLIYLVAIAGVVHYWWLVKADTREPALYAALVALLLGYRLWVFRARLVPWLRSRVA